MGKRARHDCKSQNQDQSPDQNHTYMNGITYLPQLTLTEALEEAWSKIVQVKGRSRRSEFWWTYLILAIIKMICMFIPIIGSKISYVINAATIPLVFRRLHDTGRSGWWFGGYIILSVIFVIVFLSWLYNMIQGNDFTTAVQDSEFATLLLRTLLSPTLITIGALTFAYGIIMLIFLCQDSQIHENKYGPSPKYKVEEPEENIPEYVPEWK